MAAQVSRHQMKKIQGVGSPQMRNGDKIIKSSTELKSKIALSLSAQRETCSQQRQKTTVRPPGQSTRTTATSRQIHGRTASRQAYNLQAASRPVPTPRGHRRSPGQGREVRETGGPQHGHTIRGILFPIKGIEFGRAPSTATEPEDATPGADDTHCPMETGAAGGDVEDRTTGKDAGLLDSLR